MTGNCARRGACLIHGPTSPVNAALAGLRAVGLGATADALDDLSPGEHVAYIQPILDASLPALVAAREEVHRLEQQRAAFRRALDAYERREP